MNSILEISNLKKNYRDKESELKVLKDISLRVPQGALFGLLGRNGAGKSTLINIIAGTVKKTSGHLRVCGFDIDEEPSMIKQNIGVVPQDIIFDPFLSVRETLEYHAGYFGLKIKQNDLDEIIDAVGLTKQINTNTRKLSGGMKRRLLIAKSLVNKPKLLFLDEPTAGVDIELREQLLNYVYKLNKDGMTIVLTTHYLEEAERLCDEIAVIDDGKVIMQEKKSKILANIFHKIIDFEFAGKLSKLPNDLDRFKNKKNGNKYRFFCNNVSEVDDLLGSVKASNLIVKDVETQNVKLEDIFSSLMLKERG